MTDERCPSCGWPLSRHLVPCPLVLPLQEIKKGVDITTGKEWPTV